jgi:autoinducer 2 (AI-2) kinase
LSGQTVGLIGFGAVAREVAKRLRPFGSEVLVADPYVAEADALRAGVEKVSIDELLERSHLVSLHAAVTDETRGLISAARLDRMRRGAGLVNTARAALVDEEALEAALSSGRLGGAALDVFSVEPPGADHPLLAHANVIATPHLGGNTHQVPAHQGRIVSADLERLLRGEPPHHVLDRTVLERFDWSKARPDPDRATLESLRDRPAPSVTDLDRDRKKTPGRSAAAAVRLTGAHEAIGERMRAIVAAFAAALGRDEAIARAARERAVTLHFALTDLPIEFHLTLCGEASAGVGPPAEAAEVELRMRARVLDGMFTGTVNAMEEAMSGGLSFSGDAGKAMALQELQRDLSRIYRAARARVGDPGDLGSLPDPSGAAPPPAEHGEEGLKIELCRIVEDLYGQELITATGGNVSARIAGSEDVWITPSQLFKGDLAPGLLVRVGVDGRRRDPNSRSPSSERMMHCAVYQRKREAQAVIHAHAPHATILANAELPFLPISTEAAFFAEIPRVPFIMPGTDELAHAVAEAMGDGWAVLMKNHGLIVAGRTLRRAADMAEIIDRSAQVMLGCWQVGREPPVLPAEAVATLRKMGDLVA